MGSQIKESELLVGKSVGSRFILGEYVAGGGNI